MKKKVKAKKIDQPLQMSEISFWIDHYEDIFSDFDSRPYSQRSLSDDFLAEAKKISRERPSGTIELTFQVPTKIHRHKTETIIKKRLHEHFKRHHLLIKQETTKVRNKGFLLTGIGILFMFISTLLANLESKTFLTNFIFVLLEPSGWFMGWIGLEQIFYHTKQKQSDLDFYEKMSKCKIKFVSHLKSTRNHIK